MKFRISKEIFDKYPKTSIGYVVANIFVKDSDPYVEDMKSNLSNELKIMGIKGDNYATHPNIDGWKKVFKDFGMSKGYRSSVEALVRRIATGDKMWNISNVVDLYNCSSVLSMIPMGGYDLDKVKGDITLRFGKELDSFDPLGSKDKVVIDPKHVVYSDDERVICWLWNYRDSKFTSINKETKQAIFFLDSAFELKHLPMEKAIQIFENNLAKIGAVILSDGILDVNKPEIEIPLQELSKKEIEFMDYSEIMPKKMMFQEEVKENKKEIKKANLGEFKEFKKITHEFKPAPIETLATPDQVINAAATGNLELLKKVIEFKPDLANAFDWYGNTALIHAVRGDHPAVVDFLLGYKLADINHQNKGGETALIVGSRFGCEKTVPLLLSYGANVELANNENETALSIAKSKNHQSIALTILNAAQSSIVENKEKGESKEVLFLKESHEIGASSNIINISESNQLTNEQQDSELDEVAVNFNGKTKFK